MRQKIILCGPSGVGKGSLIRGLKEIDKNFEEPISHTTRPPRSGEVDGKDYHFVSRKVFEKMLSDYQFLEWAEVHGNLYGTSKKALDSISNKKDLIFDIDYQGAKQVKEYMPEVISIFVLPNSMHQLCQQLIDRGTDSYEEIEVRMMNADIEIKHSLDFDYYIINRTLSESLDQLYSIIHELRENSYASGYIYCNPTLIHDHLSVLGKS